MLVLGISFNLTLDNVHRHSRFSKAFSEKNFKYVPSENSGPIMFNWGFILLRAKVDPIPEERGYKKDAFLTFDFCGFEILLAFMLTEVVAF